MHDIVRWSIVYCFILRELGFQVVLFIGEKLPTHNIMFNFSLSLCVMLAAIRLVKSLFVDSSGFRPICNKISIKYP